jgi:hypothetical protein
VLVGGPAAIAGTIAGWAATRRPTGRLLETLDQLPPGWDLLPPLLAAVVGVVLVVVLAAAWPAWRACGRPIAPMLRAAELGARPRGRFLPSGSIGLGMRMVVSRPVRTLSTAAVLAASAAVVLLMLSLATLLGSLERDPGAIGKRYQLTARASAARLPLIRSLPGVAAAAQRFSVTVADSYQLGQTFQLVAYCGDRLRFEAAPLQSGRRAQHPGEAEIGVGLATALGLRPGATMAAQFPDGDEARYSVVGVVNALDNDGRIAYVQPSRRICAFHGGVTVVQLAPGAGRSQVAGELGRSGFSAAPVAAITTSNASFLATLVAMLRTLAVVDGLVCLYAVAQMLALMARERRPAMAVLRACGAGSRQLISVFAGAALLVCSIAAPAAVLLERTVLGPATAHLATDYADVSLSASSIEIGMTVVGLAAIVLAAATLVGQAAVRHPIVAGLRDERG